MSDPEAEKPRWRRPDWLRVTRPDLSAITRPSRRVMAVTGWTSLALIFAWLVFIWALTQPRYATPLANWGLHTFADKSANVSSARLRHMFSTTFDVQRLDWPEKAAAESMALQVNLFGWLPGVPWLNLFQAREGGFTMAPSTGNKSSFNPQTYVDRVDIKGFDLTFNRRGQPRTIHIVTAEGSLAKGTLRAEATADRSRLTFEGMAKNGSNLKGRVTAEGENVAYLAEVAGVTSPDTPPFKISGELMVRDRSWSFSSISGRVGDSDIAGTTIIELRPERPFVDADLVFASLDFDDLGVVFGIPLGTGDGESTNDKQREAKAVYDRSARLIPDAEIDFGRLAAVDANFSVRADKVIDAPFGIDAIEIIGALNDRLLKFETFSLKSGKGGLDATVSINARNDPAHTEASGKLTGLPISRFVSTKFVEGDLRGTFALQMDGSGFRDAFASATGEIGLWSPNSRLAKIAVEGAGLDVGEALLQYLGGGLKDPEYIASRCAVANFALKNGQAQLQPGIIDNSDSLIQATGGFSLRDESIDMKIKTRPKDISLGSLSGDIDVGGTLRRPRIDALDDDALVQLGFTALLTSIAGPLGALPFIETGDGEDAPCGALLREAQTASRQGPSEPSPDDANRVVRPG
jgi:uncharacterized protein involved in outer membrane biogenesis